MKDNSMEKVLVNFLIKMNISVIGVITNSMEMENIYFLNKKNILKEILKMVDFMVKEHIFMKMEVFIVVIGHREVKKD
jgi:hypothetical protein